MITVENKVRVYEVDGSDPVPPSMEHITVSSHWNRDALVVLKVPGCAVTYTVVKRDLEIAIQNACNINR